MNDLSPEARDLLDAARADDHLTPDDRRRMRAAIAAKVALAAGAGVVAGSTAAQAAAAPAGLGAQAAAKLSWTLAALSTTKGVAVVAAVATLSTAAAVTQHARARADRAPPRAVTTSAPARRAPQPPRAAKEDPHAVAGWTVTATASATVTVSPAAAPAPESPPAPVLPPTPREATQAVPPRVPARAVASPEPSPPSAPAPALTVWECAQEIDRALLRDDAPRALAWVARCRAHEEGPHGAMLGAREVTALCAEGRHADATAAALRVVTLDPSQSTRRRLERTCVRDALRGAP